MYQQSITILDEIIQDSNSRIGLVSCDEAQGELSSVKWQY